jgi:hypothetical protein
LAEITRPTIVDDSGTFTDGTVINEAFFDDIFDEIDDQCHSATNTTIKPKATTDEVVTARGNLANLNARISGVVDADGNPVAAAGQATETQVARAEGNINLVLNSDLEDWTAGTTSAPDDYTLSGASAAILKTGAGEADTTDLGTGTYAAKITSGAGAAAKLTQAIIATADYSKYRSVDGRKVGFAIRAKVANSSVLRVVVDDGVTTTASAYATGSADEQTLTVVHTISDSATKLDVYAEVALGGNVAYVGGFTAVFSDLAPLWNPGWAKFRQDILDETIPTQVKIGGVPKTVAAAGVLLSSHTTSQKDTNGDTYYTIVIPGGTLGTDGDRLRVKFFVLAENTTAQNIAPFAQFGATAVTVVQVGSGATTRFEVEVEIVRTGAATQRMIQRHISFNATGGASVTYIPAAVTPGETLSGDVNLTLKLSASGTRVTVAQGYTVEFLPAVA